MLRLFLLHFLKETEYDFNENVQLSEGSLKSDFIMSKSF